MQKHIDFPENAFRKEGMRERLLHAFTGRAYRAEDVKEIRTSLHYKNFHCEGPEQKYETAIAFAYRQEDGNFSISILRAAVAHNTIQPSFCVYNHSDNERETCAAGEVIGKMAALEKKLRAESQLSQSYPVRAPLRYRDALHVDAAAMVFAEPATSHDIVSNIQRNIIRDYGMGSVSMESLL